jgi:hypothetical protein
MSPKLSEERVVMNFSEMCSVITEKGIDRLFTIVNVEENIGVAIPLTNIKVESDSNDEQLVISGITDHDASLDLLKNTMGVTPPVFAHYPIRLKGSITIRRSDVVDIGKDADVCTFVLETNCGTKTIYKIFLS